MTEVLCGVTVQTTQQDIILAVVMRWAAETIAEGTHHSNIGDWRLWIRRDSSRSSSSNNNNYHYHSPLTCNDTVRWRNVIIKDTKWGYLFRQPCLSGHYTQLSTSVVGSLPTQFPSLQTETDLLLWIYGTWIACRRTTPVRDCKWRDRDPSIRLHPDTGT